MAKEESIAAAPSSPPVVTISRKAIRLGSSMPSAVPETVLLIDDDAAFRDVYRELLAGDGYLVAEARSAPDALVQIKKSSARLVILDLMLPPSGRPEEGAAIAEKILAERPSAKVIVVSGAGETPL